jgi:hypothetical protein
MCFSPEADLVAGIVVSGVGLDTIRHAQVPREFPLAALPLMFGIHQLVEAIVWWGLDGRVPASTGQTATLLYLAVAFVLPLWVPLAVRGVEPSRRQRRLMALLAGVGALVAVVMLSAVARGPVVAVVDGRHIAYAIDIPGDSATGFFYVVATCGALLVSSDRWIRAWGGGNLVAVTVLAWLTVGGLTSLWCLWAAATSVAIDLYLRDTEHRAQLSFA